MLTICNREEHEARVSEEHLFAKYSRKKCSILKDLLVFFVAHHKLRISQEKDLKGTFLQFPTPTSSPFTSEGPENDGRSLKFRLKHFSPFSFSEGSGTFYIEDGYSWRLKPCCRSLLAHRSVGKVDVCDRSLQSLFSWINQYDLLGINFEDRISYK
jgi:hypothetical protein